MVVAIKATAKLASKTSVKKKQMKDEKEMVKEKKIADQLILQQEEREKEKNVARRQKDTQEARSEKRLSDLRDRIAESLAPPVGPDPDKIQCECGGSYSAKQYSGAFYDSARTSHIKTQVHQIWLDTGKRKQGKPPPDYRLKNAERCECGIFIPMKRMVFGKMRDDWEYKFRHVKTKAHQEYLELKHLL